MNRDGFARASSIRESLFSCEESNSRGVDSLVTRCASDATQSGEGGSARRPAAGGDVALSGRHDGHADARAGRFPLADGRPGALTDRLGAGRCAVRGHRRRRLHADRPSPTRGSRPHQACARRRRPRDRRADGRHRRRGRGGDRRGVRSTLRRGTRSVGGSLHAINFGASAGDYYKHANDEILVILQTESPTGVENADAIYSLPGVDAIFVGPNDLTAQMRGPDRRRSFPRRVGSDAAGSAGSGEEGGDSGRAACAVGRRSEAADRRGGGSSSRSAATCG